MSQSHLAAKGSDSLPPGWPNRAGPTHDSRLDTIALSLGLHPETIGLTEQRPFRLLLLFKLKCFVLHKKDVFHEQVFH